MGGVIGEEENEQKPAETFTNFTRFDRIVCFL